MGTKPCADPEQVTVEALAGPDAAQLIAGLRATSPVQWVPAIDGWLVTGHELGVQVMRDDKAFTVDDPRFSTARVTGPSMLSLDGPEHRRHRNPFVGPFRPRQVVDRFEADVDELTLGLLARIRGDGTADLRSALAGPLSVNVVAAALGLRQVEVGTVLDWYWHIVNAVSTMTGTSPVPPEATAAMDALGAHLRTGLHSDQGSVLAEATSELTEAEVVANAAVMMFGGIETTEGMIANAVLHLLGHPDQLTLVERDPSLIGGAIE
ncbi:MAG TPA: hypothetical protein VFN19_07310, partial [Candidatus Nanopelagicales bacterium]|nr:hypothetical protein [Candidatus Nanopelagicales bacterium]